MILNEVKPNIESSGQLNEKFFSIADQGMIFEILRNKMYSNPILAICREYSCNARDAHREVGTPEVPIHIYLPNNLEPFYKIKDFGPGISPDRMENIFIKYTASTKRDSNIQHGGFGLGCKSAFAYSDTFSIVTNYNGIQYNYSCFIDETKVGKLALFSESPTKEPNGTEIIVPVKPADFISFKDWTEKSIRHWEVKPIIKGGTITPLEINKIFQGDGWFIGKVSSNTPNYYQHNYDYSGRSCKLIIDGIEYPLELDALKKYANTKLIDAANGTVFLYFGVGELSLSASREQIYLDKPTQAKIAAKLVAVSDEVLKLANEKISTFKNLWEANIYYRKDLSAFFSDLSFLGDLSWDGVVLTARFMNVACSVFSFSKQVRHSRRRGFPSTSTIDLELPKIRRSMQRNIIFDESSILFVNDLPIKEPTPRHVKKVFENDPSLTSVQVLCPNDKITIENINTMYHVDKMNAGLLSSITKASARKYTPSSTRLLVFKYDQHSLAFRQISYSSIKEDIKTRKVLCKFHKNEFNSGVSRTVQLSNKTTLNNEVLRTLSIKYPNVSFYGIDESASDERIDEDFGDLEPIDDFLKKEIINNTNHSIMEMKIASQDSTIDMREVRELTKLEKLISNKNSLYLKRLKTHLKLHDLREADKGILHIYELINGKIEKQDLQKFLAKNPDLNLDSLNKEYEKKYPLLTHINSYYYSEALPAIIHYINLIDSI